MIQVKRAGEHSLLIPKQESEGAAGYDLRAVINCTIHPGEQEVIPTGFAWKIPTGEVGLVRPRSGMAVRNGIDVMAGVIDSDYRGEIQVVLINHGNKSVPIALGDRIAQMVIVTHHSGELSEVNELEETNRGAGGFGHTGSN